MTYDNPRDRKTPPDPKIKQPPWEKDEEEDLFGAELRIDPREELSDALDRVLARQKPQAPERSDGREEPPPRASFGPRAAADHDPFDRYAGTPLARELESIANLGQRDTKPDPAKLDPAKPDPIKPDPAKPDPIEDEDEDEFDDPEYAEPSWLDALRERWSDWLSPAAMLVAVLGALVGAAGLVTALQLSGRIERLEARLGTIVPPDDAGGVLDAEVRSNTATLRSLREEFRNTADQLRARVSEDSIALQTEMRELTSRADQRWQELETRTEELRKGTARPVAAAAAPSAPSQPTKTPPADTTKPSHSAPTGGPWAVHVASFSNAGVADQEVLRLKRLGLEAEENPILNGGQTWHRISVVGFPSREAAQGYVASAKKNPKLAPVFADSWIGRR